jgi:hypothetical protein
MSADKLNQELASAVGKRAEDDTYLNKRVHGRHGTAQEIEIGVVFATSPCNVSGCPGRTRLHVRWPSGVQTFPCVSLLRFREDLDLEVK